MASLKNTVVNNTGAITLPVGTTAQRPTLPFNGQLRYNSSFNQPEMFNINRWTYMPDIVTNGLIMRLDAGEPLSYNTTSENLLLYSEDYSNAVWDKTTYPVTVAASNITPPITGMAVYMLTTTNNLNLIFETINTSVTGQGQLTASIYAKAGTSTAFTLNPFYGGETEVNITFTLTGAGSVAGGTGTITSLGDGWYRCSCPIPATTATRSIFYYRIWPESRGTYSTKTLYVAGAQLETGSSLSDYNKTTASVKTRTTTWADISYNGNSVILNNSPTYQSANGGSFLFNGTNNWCSNPTPNLVTGSGNSTVLVFCKPDSTMVSETYTGLFSYGGRTGSNSRLLSINSTLYSMSQQLYVSSAYWGNDYTGTTMPVASNQWNMVGLLTNGSQGYNNTTFTAGTNNAVSYFTSSSSSASSTALNTTSVNLAVGCTDYPGRYFKGNISVVLMYNRILSFTELYQNFNAYRTRYSI